MTSAILTDLQTLPKSMQSQDGKQFCISQEGNESFPVPSQIRENIHALKMHKVF